MKNKRKPINYNNLVPAKNQYYPSLMWVIPEGKEDIYHEICENFGVNPDKEDIKIDQELYYDFIEELKENKIIILSQN